MPPRVERVEKLRRLAVRERLEPHVHALPLGPLLEQLRTCDAEEEDRRAATPAAHVLHEVEQRRLGPVDVLQDDERAAVPARGARRAAVPPRRAPPAERLPRPPSTRRRSTTRAASGSSPIASATPCSPPRRWMSSVSGQKVIPSPYGRQRPEATVAYAPTSATNSDTSRVLPTPAAPITVTSRHSRRSALGRQSVPEHAELVASGRRAACPSDGRTSRHRR